MQSRSRIPNKSLKKPQKKLSFIPFLILLGVLVIIILVYWQFKSKNNNLQNFTVIEKNTADVTFTEPESTLSVQDEIVSDFTPNANNSILEKEELGQEEIPARTQSQQDDYSQFSEKYDQALKLFYAKKYSEAKTVFSELQQQYPAHSFQVNCQHWIGECYFGMEDYTSALDAFHKVLDFGKTYKTDDALLMIGRSYHKLGDKVNARLYFNRLINEYPFSEYIDKAQWHLSRL